MQRYNNMGEGMQSVYSRRDLLLFRLTAEAAHLVSIVGMIRLATREAVDAVDGQPGMHTPLRPAKSDGPERAWSFLDEMLNG